MIYLWKRLLKGILQSKTQDWNKVWNGNRKLSLDKIYRNKSCNKNQKTMQKAFNLVKANAKDKNPSKA